MTTGSRLPWEPSLDLLLDLKATERWVILMCQKKFTAGYYARGRGGGGVLRISSDGDDQMEAKVKTKKNR